MTYALCRPCLRIACLLASLILAPALHAQDASARQSVNVRELIEAEQETDQVIQEIKESASRDETAVSTPLRSLIFLAEAGETQDYSAATEYLDLRYLPEELDSWTPEELLRALSYVFRQQNIVNLANISDQPEGRRNDGLPEYRDLLGEVVMGDETVPIYLQRVPDGKGGKVWKISNATVARIPAMWDELGYSSLVVHLSKLLPEGRILGMENWQAFAALIFIIVAWPLAALLTALLQRLVLAIYDRFPVATSNFIRGPLRFFTFLAILRWLLNQLGLSLKMQILLESAGIDYIAFTVLLLGVISFVRDFQIRKMQRAGNLQYAALLKPMVRILKVIVVVIIALVWASRAGYNMSTILAGLGVGSLAVALAAQKTLENVIGAATLYAARPVKAGDFCRFGSVTGTVEEIGLRSTIIRTLDRTQVVIPNSVFASGEVENFSQRDRIRYYRRFRIQLGSADQMRFILARIRATLASHPMVLQDTVSARFETIEDATGWLRLDAGVETTDFQEFLAVAEDINLRIVEIVAEAGSAFAGPGRLLQSAAEGGDGAEHASETLRQWRGQDRLPFPNYSEEQLAEMKGSLDYPPKGAAG
jgi:MscS family membrane protein